MTRTDPLKNAEVISSYSRAQAIADGLLKPVPPEVAVTFGFRLPLVLTQKLWSALTAFKGSDSDANAVAERMFTILRMARDAAIRGEKESDIQFGCPIPTNSPRYFGPDDATLRMILHGGDDGEVVATLGYANDEW